MKKFLFTLAALLMASTAFAADLTSTDLEITSEMIGKQQLLPLNMVLENEYVNGWEMYITYPEGVTAGNPKKNTAVLNQMVPNADGDEEMVTPLGDCLANRIVQAYGSAGYWDSDDNGTFESYGAVKIGPTGTFKLYDLRVTPNEGFTGGDIVIEWMFTGGFDHRNGQTSVSQSGTLTIHLTVAQAPAQPAPVPTFREEGGKLYAECANHEVVLMDAEGNVLPNPYELPANTSYTDALVLNFKAYTKANADESGNSAEVTYQVTIPALDKKDVDSPSIQGMTGENGTYYIIIAPAELGKGLEVEWEADPTTTNYTVDENGIVTLIYNRGAEDVPVNVLASTKATTEYNASDVEEATITVPALPQVKTPEINYVVNGDGTFTVTATCDTEGATIVLKDKDGNIVNNPATVTYDPYVGYNGTWTATATAPYYQPSETGSKLIEIGANEKADVESPSIMGMKHEGSKKLYDIVITPDPATDGELDYDATPMGTVLRAGATTIQYERGAEAYTVHVEAWTNEGATCKASEKEIKDITVPALDQVAKPTINWAPNGDGTFDIWVSCDTEDAVITLTDGTTTYTVAPGEHKTITYNIYDGYEATWNATAKATDMLDNTADPKEIIIDEEQKVYQTPDPVIGDPVVTAENVTITVTGEGNLSVTYTDGTQTYGPFTGTNKVVITIPRGEEDNIAYINATATATPVPEGYDAVASGRATSGLIDIPAKEYSDAPVIVPTPGKSEWDEDGNQTVDGHVVTVTFEAVEGAEIYYSMDGENFEKWDGDPIEFRDNGDYTVYAYAVEPGKMPSEVKSEPIHVDESTSVNGLVNGKTVAGVRYFNMAGQEMQEANGVTIVVTTYTDGTTSAVKVIK